MPSSRFVGSEKKEIQRLKERASTSTTPTVHKDLSFISVIPKWSGSDDTATLELGSRGVGRAVSGVAVLRYGWPSGGRQLFPRGDRCVFVASLHSRPSVHSEEPYPTRGDPVFMQNTADLKE
jgi:hypothetical protein